MRIAVFHELQFGGAIRAVNEISKRLKKKNIVDLYLVDQSLGKEEIKYFSKVNFYKFSSKQWAGKNPVAKFYKDTVELIKLYRFHKTIAKEIDSKDYDFVFVHPSKFTQAPFILRFLKTKKIYYSEETLRMIYEQEGVVGINVLKQYYEKLNRIIRKEIDRKNIKSADLILANSNFTKNNIYKAYRLKSKMVYLGVDVSFFKPGRKSRDIDILYVGSKDESNGYNLLSQSINLLNIKLKIEYVITGQKWVTDSTLRDLYARSKIVIAFYKNEPFGLIPLEAMSSGSVVIALDQGGYKETIINGKTGYLVPADPKLISKKINHILSNTNLAKNMGEYARKIMIGKWSWDKRVKEFENVFNQFIKS